MSTSNESVKNIIIVSLVVCLVCSILVATAAVVLKPRQDANKKLEQRKNVLVSGDLIQEGKPFHPSEVGELFSQKIAPFLLDIQEGKRLPKDRMTGNLDPERFDIKKISKDPATSDVIPSKDDIAGIKRKPRYVIAYFVKDGDKIEKIIFPVIGKGLWSTLYGFLAVDKNLETVRGFTIYEHGETPGLGGEVDNIKWKESWKGKIGFNDSGELVLKVIKGKTMPGTQSEIDGLSGATLTTRGVDNMIKFWFGPQGYGPFLTMWKKEGFHE